MPPRLFTPNGGPSGPPPQLVVATPMNDIQLVCLMAAHVLANPVRMATPEEASLLAQETYVRTIAHMQGGTPMRFKRAAAEAAGMTDPRDAEPDAEPDSPPSSPLEIA